MVGVRRRQTYVQRPNRPKRLTAEVARENSEVSYHTSIDIHEDLSLFLTELTTAVQLYVLKAFV